VGYEDAVLLALSRRITRAALHTMMAVPRIAVVLTELRDAVRHLERLATFAAEELPEVVYQLEHVRAQLAAIERRLGTAGERAEGREAGRTGHG
jgi:hypothetical protein